MRRLPAWYCLLIKQQCPVAHEGGVRSAVGHKAACRSDGQQFLLVKRLDLEVASRGGQGDDGDIDAIGLQIAQNVVGIADADGDFEAGHGFSGNGDGARKQMDRCRAATANAHPATSAISVRHHRFFCSGRFLEQPPCMHEQVEACRGRLRPPPDAFDQPDAEPLFEPLHLQADGRLRQAFLVGRSRKASEIGDIDEGGKLLEVERHTKEILMHIIISISFFRGIFQRIFHPLKKGRRDGSGIKRDL